MNEQLLSQEIPSTLNIYQRVAILEQQIKILLKNNQHPAKVMCSEDIKDLQKKHIFSCDNVSYIVCLDYELTLNQLKSRSRVRNLVEARQMVSFITYVNNKNETQKGIGRFLDRDHSTVIYAMRSVRDRISIDAHEKERHDNIIKKINEVFG